MREKNTQKARKRKYPLNQIYFYLTEGCNLRCRHCWISPKYQSEGSSYPTLDLNLFRSIIDQAKPLGLSGVKLTGGEPLLHPEIQSILEFVQREGFDLTVETNGALCTSELARKIAVCKSPFVAVSLDGTDAETHEWVRGVPGCFDDALAGIRNLVIQGLKPQIIMTIMRRNKDQMEDLVQLAESLGAGSVKFNILQPTARGEKMHNDGETLAIEELVELGRWVENTLSASTRLRVIYGHPMAFRPLGKMFGNDRDGCGVCGILGILGVLGDGSYALCGIGETVPELVFGHSAKDRLEEVWRETPVLLELRDEFPHSLEGICGDCLMRYRCLGGCVAQNYYRKKNIWAAFWYCEKAQRQGLFPKSRVATRRLHEPQMDPAFGTPQYPSNKRVEAKIYRTNFSFPTGERTNPQDPGIPGPRYSES